MSFKIILSIFFIHFCINMIVFPFKTIKNNINEIDQTSEEYNTTHFVKDYWSLPSYSIIKIGEPPQEVKVLLTYNDCGFKIGKSDKCVYEDNYLSHYNRNSSSDFRYTNYVNRTIYEFNGKGSSAEDSIYAYTDLELKNLKKFKNIGFFLGTDTNDELCGIIGLKNNNYRLFCEYINNFFKSFKLREYISSNDWIIKYTSKDEGLFIFAPELDKVFPNYDFNKLFITNSDKDGASQDWTVIIDKIYSGDNNKTINKKALKAEINNDFGLLEGNGEYFYNITETYFYDYIKKGICTTDDVYISFYHYFALGCDKKKFGIEDMKKFPTLSLVLVSFQAEFNFTYKDLFTETKHKYFFNVIFNVFITERWVLGKICLRKYPLLINFDTQTVGYYNEFLHTDPIDDINKDNKYFIIFMILIIIILVGISSAICYFLGKNLNKIKKRKANELIDDNYEYKPSKENDDYKIFNEQTLKNNE